VVSLALNVGDGVRSRVPRGHIACSQGEPFPAPLRFPRRPRLLDLVRVGFSAARPAREVPQPLCAEGAAALGPHRPHLLRAGCERVPRGGGGIRSAARRDARKGAGQGCVGGAAPARGVCTSVERLAWARSSSCPWDYNACAPRRSGWASDGAASGAGSRMPVEQVDYCGRLRKPLVEDTSRC